MGEPLTAAPDDPAAWRGGRLTIPDGHPLLPRHARTREYARTYRQRMPV